MREILFRGKCAAKWLYGNINCVNPMCIDEIIVNPESVGQYTGLDDKNGAKIFEGDVVVIDDTVKEEFIIGFVVYNHAEWQIDYGFDTVSLYRQLVELKEYKTVEVVGNIHDNPETLRGIAQFVDPKDIPPLTPEECAELEKDIEELEASGFDLSNLR